MPPYENQVWNAGGTPAIARVLQKRIFGGETEFPVGTTLAYKHSTLVNSVITKIARFNGEMWEVTGDPHALSTIDLVDRLGGDLILKVWLLDDGATIYQKDQKEGF